MLRVLGQDKFGKFTFIEEFGDSRMLPQWVDMGLGRISRRFLRAGKNAGWIHQVFLEPVLKKTFVTGEGKIDDRPQWTFHLAVEVLVQAHHTGTQPSMPTRENSYKK